MTHRLSAGGVQSHRHRDGVNLDILEWDGGMRASSWDEPQIGARDNLETLALCEAVFAAAAEHRATTPREFLS